MIPQVYLAYLIATVLVLGGVYVKGRVDGASVCDARVTELLAESATRERNAQQQAINATQALEIQRGKTEIKYKTLVREVEKVVDRPVYSNVCLDADGLRLANAALAGSTPASRIPADALPPAP